jgi:TolB-like protein
VTEGGGEEQASGADTGTPAVFISYASQDTVVADAVVLALERQGLKCWVAPRDVTPGEFYADAIVRALNDAPIFVLVLTANAVTSPHVLREVERASAKRHPIISFRIGSVSLPPALEYFLSASHWLDASASGIDGTLPKLVAAVQRLVAGPSVADPGHVGDSVNSVGNLFQHPTVGRAPSTRVSLPAVAFTALIAAIVVYLVVDKLWLSKHTASERQTSAEPPAAAAAPAALVISKESVAVLPFLDMSEKKDQEYFSDGLSEELIDLLTKVPGLHVTARKSSFYFKGKSEDIPTIAKRLLVAYVLEGSVRKSGNRLRVTAQLVRADNGYHLWSETYDRNVDDIFKVQDEIAGAVVKELKISLLGTEKTRPAPTANSEAYALYMQAGALILRGAVTDSARAADYLQLAIKLDPKFAPAYARLTQVRTFQYENGSLPYEQAIVEARRAAQQAIELDPTLSAAHLSMARVHYFEWDWGSAEAEIQRARQLDPGDADALRWAGISARTLGHLSESIGLLQQAVDLDPLNGANYAMLTEAHLAGGEFAAAELACRKAIELAPPNGFGARAGLGTILVAIGRPAAALTVFEQLDDEDDREAGKALAYFALGRKADSDAALAVLETRFAGTDAYAIAQVQAYRGEINEAFKWLDRAYRQRAPSLNFAKTDWSLTKLRGDPRYKGFLRKMNLPE